jgi:hypothetical protein
MLCASLGTTWDGTTELLALVTTTLVAATGTRRMDVTVRATPLYGTSTNGSVALPAHTDTLASGHCENGAGLPTSDLQHHTRHRT